MVVIASKDSSIRYGMRLIPGALQLIWLRFVVMVLASLPALLWAYYVVGKGPGHNPYFTEINGRLPTVHLARLYYSLPSSLLIAIAASVIFALIANQVLTASALIFFEFEHAKKKNSIIKLVAKEGFEYLWVFVRIVFVSALIFAVGVWGIEVAFKKIITIGTPAGWGGVIMEILLPSGKAFCIATWFAIVGAWGMWCKIQCVVDEMRSVFRLGFSVFSIWWRHPLRAPLFFVVITLAINLFSALFLFLWRQYPPQIIWIVPFWAAGWLTLMFVQSYVWYWLLHAARILYVMKGQ